MICTGTDTVSGMAGIIQQGHVMHAQEWMAGEDVDGVRREAPHNEAHLVGRR